MSHSSSEHDYRPTASLPVLRLRAEMLDWLRQFFRRESYWEVETPVLSHDVCVDAWLEPFHVDVGTVEQASSMYLQTSPEFGMKRLLAAGAEAIFQITRAFRQEESGPLHNPEFTIVEWYRVGDTYHQQMELVEQLVAGFQQHVVDVASGIQGLDVTEHMRRSLTRPFRRLTYEAAFQEAVGADVLSKSTAELRSLARASGIEGPTSLRDDDRDGWLNLLLSECVEPILVEQGPVFLYDYPSSQAALAKIRKTDAPVAERFELYVDGIEICNGYQELTDVGELRHRQAEQSEKRRQEGLPRLPEESRLLQSMEAGLPECSGVALGFDRLLLTALGMSSIDDVTAFPFARA